MILLELFYIFFKIGLLTFGGGYAMIPMIKAEVISKGWLNEEMLLNFLAVSESTPGSFAVNIATFVGTSQAGILGAICATLGVVFPSFIIILIIYQFYKRFISNKYVSGIMSGIRAVVVGLIIGVAIDLVFNEIFTIEPFSFDLVAVILFIILIVIDILYRLLLKKKLNPIMLIIIAGILGIFTYGVIL